MIQRMRDWKSEKDRNPVEDSIDDSLIDWGIYYEKEPMDYECPEHTQQEE